MRFFILLLMSMLLFSCSKKNNKIQKKLVPQFKEQTVLKSIGCMEASHCLSKNCKSLYTNIEDKPWRYISKDQELAFDFYENELYMEYYCGPLLSHHSQQASKEKYIDYKVIDSKILLSKNISLVVTNSLNKNNVCQVDIPSNFTYGFEGKCVYFDLSDNLRVYMEVDPDNGIKPSNGEDQEEVIKDSLN